MRTIEERNEIFYTEKGMKALENRLKNWIGLFNKDRFPMRAKMLGFGDFVIKNKNDCLARIRELSEIIGTKITIESELIKYKDREVLKETIK